MMEFWNMKTTLLIVTISLCAIMPSGVVYATIDNEKLIEELFEVYGKNSVVNFIKEKRDGKITIEKNKSFTDIYGKPNLLYITPKSTIQDLKILEMSIDGLTSVLEEQKRQQEKDGEIDEEAASGPTSNREDVPLSVQLNQKIKITRDSYDKASSNEEKRRLKAELTILQGAYDKATKNEKSALRVYFPDKEKNTSYKKSSSSCRDAKARLQKLNDPVFRHQVYFCGGKEYRSKNQKICRGYGYGRQYNLYDYNEDINKARESVSINCGP